VSKKHGVYVKPSAESIAYFQAKAAENRRALADEIGLFIDDMLEPKARDAEEGEGRQVDD
jgi:hypothetical protein